MFGCRCYKPVSIGVRKLNKTFEDVNFHGCGFFDLAWIICTACHKQRYKNICFVLNMTKSYFNAKYKRLPPLFFYWGRTQTNNYLQWKWIQLNINTHKKTGTNEMKITNQQKPNRILGINDSIAALSHWLTSNSRENVKCIVYNFIRICAFLFLQICG